MVQMGIPTYQGIDIAGLQAKVAVSFLHWCQIPVKYGKGVW